VWFQNRRTKWRKKNAAEMACAKRQLDERCHDDDDIDDVYYKDEDRDFIEDAESNGTSSQSSEWEVRGMNQEGDVGSNREDILRDKDQIEIINNINFPTVPCQSFAMSSLAINGSAMGNM